MIRRTTRSTRTYSLFPYPPLFRSGDHRPFDGRARRAHPRAAHPRPLPLGFGLLADRRADAVPVGRKGASRLSRRGSAGMGRLRRLRVDRSEEHTSELQSLMRISSAVFCLKKKTRTQLTDARS